MNLGMPLPAVRLDHRFGGGDGLMDFGGLVHANRGDITATALGADFPFDDDVIIREHKLDALEMRGVDARLETVFTFRPLHIGEGAKGGFERVFVGHKSSRVGV